MRSAARQNMRASAWCSIVQSDKIRAYNIHLPRTGCILSRLGKWRCGRPGSMTTTNPAEPKRTAPSFLEPARVMTLHGRQSLRMEALGMPRSIMWSACLAKALIDVGPADREIGLQIGQFKPCILKTTNRRSKGVALPNILFREIERLLRCSDRMQRNGQSLLRQLAHQSSHRAAFRSQQIAERDAHLVEEQL